MAGGGGLGRSPLLQRITGEASLPRVGSLMERYIEVSHAEQRLRLYEQGEIVMDVLVSTSSKGAGEIRGSEQTPRGWHYIRAKIGADAAPNTVFKGRRPTGEIYSAELGVSQPGRDWMLTRILWLCGLEPGKNRLGDVDTMGRYIYIHGTPEPHAAQRRGGGGRRNR